MSTAELLYDELQHVEFGSGGPFSEKQCQDMAPIVDEINALKKEKNAVILAHYYVDPQIITGVGDFVGDSYKLAKDAKGTNADIIVFAAVKFMAETAKVLNPDKTVYVPSKYNGCSLADAVTDADVRRLKTEFPEHTFVCYINTTAAVKAECDVCVTSSNVYDIIERLPTDKIYFLPDRLMGLNVRDELARRGVEKDIQLYDGTCYVHEAFDADRVEKLRAKYPEVRVLAHPECAPDIIAKADHVASTKGMMQYLQDTDYEAYLLLTECGLASRAEIAMPDKKFIGPCVECRYMKSNTLEDILRVLKQPDDDDRVEIDASVRDGALACIENMFKYAEMKSSDAPTGD
ncbi:MAG: quinolinate synthase [Kiritimatiellia bacterium]|jgi:quinolinate synthase